MNSEKYKEVGLNVLSQTLENAAFVFVDNYEDCTIDPLNWNCQGVSLNFTGKIDGEIHIWAEKEFCRHIAANMLGMDEEELQSSDKCADAFKELLNMMVGNLLTEAFGTEPVFDLGLPKLLDKNVLLEDVYSNRASWLKAEGYPVLLIINIG
ncbi:chemotaxis protein CheX [Chitinispirillales bacterium ANBcel5]|uniref:chemotaxis protein CheX n=1 Tax=Cellulosispirillum alkaliphilum TaxID=3039283 RepID=UPI002A55F598|nr:chemotaxis protein CheX [Chitinispirillales bacterium ANBcel5]